MGLFDFATLKERGKDEAMEGLMAELEEGGAAADGAARQAAPEPLHADGHGAPEVGSYRVNVHLIECRELAGVDRDGLSDPYIKVLLGEQEFHTRTVTKNLNPYFDESTMFELDVPNKYMLASTAVRIEVWDGADADLKAASDASAIEGGLRATVDAAADAVQGLLFKDTLIGAFDLVLGDVWEAPGHEYFRQWFGLSDPAAGGADVRGYLCGSVGILAEGEKIVVRSSYSFDSEIRDVLMPSNVQTVAWSIELSCLEAKDLTAQDDRSESDPYVLFQYGGTRVRTDKVSDNANPQFNEMLAIPAMMPIQSGAEQYAHYLAWNQMSLGVMDSDLGRDDLIAKRSLAEFVSAHLRTTDNPSVLTTGYRWVNIYGAPHGIKLSKVVKGLFGREEAPAKMMNQGKTEGSAYRGRVLVRLDAHRNSEPEQKQKGDHKLSTARYVDPRGDGVPPLTDYELRLWVLEGVVGGPDENFSVRVSCGSFVSSSEPVQTRHGHGSFYEEVAVELKGFPRDRAQLPDVFIDLYRGEDRVSYLRLPAASLPELSGMMSSSGLPNAKWRALKRDIFGPLERDEFPGEVLMVAGMTDPSSASLPERLVRPRPWPLLSCPS